MQEINILWRLFDTNLPKLYASRPLEGWRLQKTPVLRGRTVDLLLHPYEIVSLRLTK